MTMPRVRLQATRWWTLLIGSSRAHVVVGGLRLSITIPRAGLGGARVDRMDLSIIAPGPLMILVAIRLGIGTLLVTTVLSGLAPVDLRGAVPMDLGRPRIGLVILIPARIGPVTLVPVFIGILSLHLLDLSFILANRTLKFVPESVALSVLLRVVLIHSLLGAVLSA